MQTTSLPGRKYLNDFHRKNSEASQKEVQTMLKRPYSLQEVKEQVDEFKKDGEWIRTVQSRNYNKTS